MNYPPYIQRLLAQCQRFELHAQAVQSWSINWPLSTFADWLQDQTRPLIYYEYALTALALKATSESGAIIDAFDSSNSPRSLQTFHQIARIEWETRFKDHHPRPSAA